MASVVPATSLVLVDALNASMVNENILCTWYIPTAAGPE